MPLEMEYQRVRKSASPLLVIGLGGTGAKGVRAVKELFEKRYELPVNEMGKQADRPVNTEYLVIDSDVDTIANERLLRSDFVDITVPNMDWLLDPAYRNARLENREIDWVHEQMNATSDGIGAGTRRQASRLMYFRNYEQIKAAITNKLSAITRTTRGALPLGVVIEEKKRPRVEVVIIAGICGGTGSGTFLDVAQLIRHINKEPEYLNLKLHVTGNIVMPDISLQGSDDESLQKVWKTNAFAALKELDFWMDVDRHKTPYSTTMSNQDTVVWNRPPFDQCALISGSDITGNRFSNPMKVAMDTIAENLLHYLVVEDNAHTFIQHEDNIAAAKEVQTRNKPVGHHYRVIGAYSCFVPKKRIINYEGKLVLDRIIPPKNEFMQPVISKNLIIQSKIEEEALRIVGKIAEMGSLVANKYAPMRSDVTEDWNNSAAMNRIRSIKPELHKERVIEAWNKNTVQPGLYNAAEEYFKAAWMRFVAFASHVIKTPEEGPNSLYLYIKDENEGLLTYMRQEQAKWVGLGNNARKKITECLGNCDKLYGAFERPGFLTSLLRPVLNLLGVHSVEEGYMTQLKEAYMSVRREVFYQKYAEKLDKLIVMIEDYADNCLKPICRALEDLSTDCDEAVDAGAVNGAEMVRFTDVQAKVEAAFNEANAEEAVIHAILANISEESFEYQDLHMEFGAGVKWNIDTINAEQKLSELVERKLAETFQAVHGQSLNAVTMQVYTEPEQREKHIAAVCRNVITNAAPLFMAVSGELNTAVKYAFVSIPKDAPAYKKIFVREAATTQIRLTEPRLSEVTDQIYCLVSWDGVPLAAYSMMRDLEAQYEAHFQSSAAERKGVHLVQVYGAGNRGDWRKNWACLPSPRPFMLYMDNANAAISSTVLNNARKTLDAALEAGSITYTISDPQQINVTLQRAYYAQSMTLYPSQEICEQVQAIMASDGSWEEKQNRLLEIGNASTHIMIPVNGLEAFVCNYPRMDVSCMNPFAQDIAADKMRQELAWKNRDTLAKDAIVYRLYCDPRICQEIMMQTEGYRARKEALTKVEAEIQQIKERKSVWAEMAKTVMPLFVRLVSVGQLQLVFGGDYMYMNRYTNEEVFLVDDALSRGIRIPESIPSYLQLIRVLHVLYEQKDKPVLEYLKLLSAPYESPKELMKQRENFGNWKEYAQRLAAEAEREGGLLRYEMLSDMDEETKAQCLSLLQNIRMQAEMFAEQCKQMM